MLPCLDWLTEKKNLQQISSKTKTDKFDIIYIIEQILPFFIKISLTVQLIPIVSTESSQIEDQKEH